MNFGNLLHWAVVFLVVAIIAALLGFSGVAGTAMEGAGCSSGSRSSCSSSRSSSDSTAEARRAVPRLASVQKIEAGRRIVLQTSPTGDLNHPRVNSPNMNGPPFRSLLRIGRCGVARVEVTGVYSMASFGSCARIRYPWQIKAKISAAHALAVTLDTTRTVVLCGGALDFSFSNTMLLTLPLRHFDQGDAIDAGAGQHEIAVGS